MKFEGLLRELWHSKWVVFRFVIKVYMLAIPRTLLYIEDLLNQGSTVHSRQDKTRQDKTRQDIYYQNISCTISWHAVSQKTLVVACQINSITKQILQIISNQEKAKKKKRRLCVIHYVMFSRDMRPVRCDQRTCREHCSCTVTL